MTRARVLLADDHVIVREAIECLLRASFDLVASVSDGRALIEATRQLTPDVVVSDISMPELGGIEAVRELRREGLKAKVVFLTMHADWSIAIEAFRAGASGYLLKRSSGEELVSAIEKVMEGGIYISPLIAKDVISMLLHLPRKSDRVGVELTPRQVEVLALIAEGLTMKEVGTRLRISTRTAESYKTQILQRLGAHSSAELIQYAVKHGLIAG
jgi:DNA-binding NarL/FixJ family response regulator